MVTETKPQETKPEAKSVFWQRLAIAVPIVVAVIGCMSSIGAALAGTEPFATWLVSVLPSMATPTAGSFLTLTPLPEIPAPPTPTVTERAVLPPGQDWLEDCISVEWVLLFPGATVDSDGYCWKQPIGKNDNVIYTDKGKLVFFDEGRVETAMVAGLFTPLAQDSHIELTIDLDELKTGEIWLGIFESADINSRGVLLVIPDGDIENRPFVVRAMPSQEQQMDTEVFERDKGVYPISIDAAAGAVSFRLVHYNTREFPISSSRPWLFIGYRAEFGSNHNQGQIL